MNYLTTTKLAVKLNLERDELFARLNELGWIERGNERWILTATGKHRGGQTRSTAETGEFIVWPEDLFPASEINDNESVYENRSAGLFESAEASEGEDYIADYLDEIGVAYVSEQVITKALEDKYAAFRVADFYLSKYDIYLEFAGRWNRSEKDRRRYRDKKQMYLDNDIPCIWIYPDNLGILHYIFHRRLEDVLKNHKLNRELLAYRLGQLWRKGADNLFGLGSGVVGIIYLFPWKEDLGWVLTWGGVIFYNGYKLGVDILRIKRGQSLEVSRLTSWERD